MIVALATNPKDIDRATELVSWMADLQSYEKHSMLLVGAATLDRQQLFELGELARCCGFKNVTTIQAKTEETPAWPHAANSMWRLAATWVKENARAPFLWIEPDCAPIQNGWLDTLEKEYLAAKKAFMGTLYPHPYNHLNGVAVYHWNLPKFNPLMFNSEFYGLPFDCVRPDLTLRNAHITPLICRGLADPASNTPHSFPDEESLRIIPAACVLFHGCKDGTLIQRLRELKHPELKQNLQAPKETLIEGVTRWVKQFVTGTKTGYHSGNLGDVVYCLPAMRAAGLTNLVIGPQQRNTAICTVPIDQKQFTMLKPLLEAQSYLKSVSYSPAYPAGDSIHDLNHFRNAWVNHQLKDKLNITTLCACHFYEVGLLNDFECLETWLECGEPIQTGKVIVHRSPRYQAPSTGPQSFPWQKLVDKHHEEMLFVGLESEYESFCRLFKQKVSFFKVKDFLELAKVIKGGRCFVGNQSFPLSVAVGLGQIVHVEECPRSPDCRFNRENYHGHLVEKIEI